MKQMLIANHEYRYKRGNRDGYVDAMLELMEQDDRIVHIDLAT